MTPSNISRVTGSGGTSSLSQLDFSVLLPEHVISSVIRSYHQLGMVAHTFNPSTWEAEAGGFLSSRPAWSTEWGPGQPGLHRETLSQKTKKKKKKKKKSYHHHWATNSNDNFLYCLLFMCLKNNVHLYVSPYCAGYSQRPQWIPEPVHSTKAQFLSYMYSLSLPLNCYISLMVAILLLSWV
jgi:hypothetical protein